MFSNKMDGIRKLIRGPRQTNFSPQEKETLLKICRKYQNTIECKQTDKTTWKEKENTWAAIEKEYNECVVGEYRSAASLKKKYESVKTALRKACEQQRVLLGPHGYPFHPPSEMTTEEEKHLLDSIVVVSLFGPSNKYDNEAALFSYIYKNDKVSNVQNENCSPNIGDAINKTVLQPTIKQCDTTSNKQPSGTLLRNSITAMNHQSPSSYLIMKQTRMRNNEASSSDSENFCALTRKRLEALNLEISLLNRKRVLMEEKHKMKMEIMSKQLEYRQYLINLRRGTHDMDGAQLHHWADEDSE